MKIACTGSTGRVGQLLVKRGVVPLLCDITKEDEVEKAFDDVQPHVVIHLAAISNVDYCEEPAHKEEAIQVNYKGTVNVARACADRKILMTHLSSEHVFSGKTFLGLGGGPYKEFHQVSVPAVNYYAMTKLTAEAVRHAFPMRIIRSSYLFDWTRIMSEELPTPGTYHFPTFIRRSYIYLPHFINNLMMYANNITMMPPILHLAGSKTVSQYEFIRDFVEYFHVKDVKIKKRYRGVAGLAPRPHRAGLDVQLSRRLGFPTYSYQQGFEQMEKDVVRG